MSKKWYVIHTYSGYENKVKSELERRIEANGLESAITKVQIPVEEVTELKEGGQRVTKEAKVAPGYVLVRMEMNDHTWSIVRNTPSVTGFVGIDNKPIPLTNEEYKKIMHQNEGVKPRRTTVDFEVGQAVKIIQGPMEDFDATIAEVNPDAGKVKVLITLFGRETPVDIEIEKIAPIN